PDIGRQRPRDTGGIDAQLALVRRPKEEDVFTREIEFTRLSRLLNQIPQTKDAPPLIRMLADIRLERRLLELDHPEHQRHRLNEPVLITSDLVLRTSSRGDVTISSAVDDHPGIDDDWPGLGLEDNPLWLAC